MVPKVAEIETFCGPVMLDPGGVTFLLHENYLEDSFSGVLRCDLILNIDIMGKVICG